MIVTTPAKINLFLFITGQRDDGYHNIWTLFQKISLFDRLHIQRTGNSGISLDCPVWLPTGRDNLVYIAAEKFFNAAGIKPSVNIVIEKNIPAGGGLGGGSSDASATLSGLNRLYETPLSEQDLHRLACSLGADCPFFLLDAPAAIGTGTGTELSPVDVPDRWFVLALPDFGVSTRWAYQNFKLTTRHLDTIFDARAQIDTLLWNNDLEQAVIERYPGIDRIKEKLLETGAQAALMTGSGSTVFGVFPTEKSACEAADKLDGFESVAKTAVVRSLRYGENQYQDGLK